MVKYYFNTTKEDAMKFKRLFCVIAPLLAAGIFIDAQTPNAQEVFRNARNLPDRGGKLGIEYRLYDSGSQPGDSRHAAFEIMDIMWGSPLLRRMNKGDVIIALDGYYFYSDNDFSAYIASKRPGEMLRIKYGPAESDDVAEISVPVVKLSTLLLGEFLRGAAQGDPPSPETRNCGLSACADPDALDASRRLQQQLDQQEIQGRFK
jgi:hypothetical protein